MMVIKMITQPESFFEQRFTPKELIRQCSNSKLQTVKYDSKYPLIIGESILKYNVPQMLQKMPDTVQLELCRLAEKIFKIAEKDLCLRLLGARFGLDSVKT